MGSEHYLGRPLTIGSVALPGRALLAPLSGVTDVVFRRLAARWGAAVAVTEMVGSASLVRRDAEVRIRAERAGAGRHVVQLVGRDPGSMAEAARLSEGAGAEIIDLNFGCPAKAVTGGLAGSALMREPALALAIVDAVLKAVAVPVTVKMRLGWDDATRNAPALAAAAASAGISAVTVHGRTRQQFYTGGADWPAVAATVAAVPVPVVANGDVDGLPAARRCLVESGAAAVMIGRAAVGRPWLVGAVSAGLNGVAPLLPSTRERAAMAVEHYEGLLALYGWDVGRRHARKHLAAYADRAAEEGFTLDPACRAELVRSDEPAIVSAILARLYDEPVRRVA